VPRTIPVGKLRVQVPVVVIVQVPLAVIWFEVPAIVTLIVPEVGATQSAAWGV